MSALQQFCIDCLDPRTQRGQGWWAATGVGFVVSVLMDTIRGMRK